MKSIEEIIKGRRSIRKYKAEPVKDETIQKLLELATYAPSGGLAFGKEHPWSFIVVKNREMLDRLSDVAKVYTLKLIERMPVLARLRPMLENPDFNIFYRAPVLVIILGEKGDPVAVYDCTLAAENLMLAAYAEGLGTCWVELTKQAAQDKDLMTELGISDEYEMIACIVLGHPDVSPAIRERKPPHVLEWIR